MTPSVATIFKYNIPKGMTSCITSPTIYSTNEIVANKHIVSAKPPVLVKANMILQAQCQYAIAGEGLDKDIVHEVARRNYYEIEITMISGDPVYWRYLDRAEAIEQFRLLAEICE